MNKMYRLFFFLLSTSFLLSQQYRYAWFTDTHIGTATGESDLLKCVERVNSDSSIEFVVVTGDISEKGMNTELRRAKSILDGLRVKYYIIPGNHDTKWSESFCTLFSELWGDNKFVFEKEGVKHIGLNSGVLWRGGGGHIVPGDFRWLDSVLSNTARNTPVLLYTHHPPDGDIDNWFKVINAVRSNDVKALLYGHGHANRSKTIAGIPAVMSRSTLTAKTGWGYTVCSVNPDTMYFSELRNDTLFAPWTKITFAQKYEPEAIDSVQFSDFTGSVLWRRDQKNLYSAAPVVVDDKIITASADGELACYALDGKELWTLTLRGHICSRPAAESGLLAVATYEGEVLTIDIATGKVKQSIGLEEHITSQLALIPAFYRDEKTTGLLIGTASGNMYCYDLFYLEQIWVNNSAKGMIETKPAVAGNRVIYGSWDGYLYCLDGASGELNWRWTGANNFYYSPAACFPVCDDSAVYVVTPDNAISKIDLLLGTPVYSVKTVKGWETIGLSKDKRALFVKEISDNFSVCSSANGAVVKQYNMKSGLDTTPGELIDDDGKIVFGTKNGTVHAFVNNEVKALFNMGTARVLSVAPLGSNRYAALNMDGVLVVFTVN